LHRGPQIDKTTTDSVWLLLVKTIWQPWPEMSTDQDWIGLEPIFAGLGLDRTAFFFKIGGPGLDRTEKILVVLM